MDPSQHAQSLLILFFNQRLTFNYSNVYLYSWNWLFLGLKIADWNELRACIKLFLNASFTRHRVRVLKIGVMFVYIPYFSHNVSNNWLRKIKIADSKLDKSRKCTLTNKLQMEILIIIYVFISTYCPDLSFRKPLKTKDFSPAESFISKNSKLPQERLFLWKFAIFCNLCLETGGCKNWECNVFGQFPNFNKIMIFLTLL